MTAMNEGVLCARLYGHMAAWGTSEAGNAVRPSGRRPGRGAIIGLISAAMGIPRDDGDGLRRISDGLVVAVASHGPRRIVEDFRTTQTITSTTRAAYSSRAEALQKGSVVTSITGRQHIEDGLWRIFVAERSPGTGIELTTVAEALRRPGFELYLGRREFPLAMPTDQRLVEGALEDALNAYPAVPADIDGGFRNPMNAFYRVLEQKVVGNKPWDLEWDIGFPGAPVDGEIRSVIDDPFSRSAWRFRPRRVGFKNMGSYQPDGKPCAAMGPVDLDEYLPEIVGDKDEFMPEETA